jgi:hypothetical protein
VRAGGEEGERSEKRGAVHGSGDGCIGGDGEGVRQVGDGLRRFWWVGGWGVRLGLAWEWGGRIFGA